MHEGSSLLHDGFLLLGFALAFVLLFRRLGLGATLGYLLAGAVVGPQVLGAVTQMRSQMEGTSQAVAHSMQQVQGAMGRTSEDLNGVVTSIKDGVTEYSRQLAALHLDMDTAMAKAVGKLGGAIQDLNESIEDLNDGLEAFREKT